MSEKQDFNKGAYIRQIAEKRRERWKIDYQKGWGTYIWSNADENNK